MLFSSLLSFLPSANIFFFFLTNTSNPSPRVQNRFPIRVQEGRVRPGCPSPGEKAAGGDAGWPEGGVAGRPSPAEQKKSS